MIHSFSFNDESTVWIQPSTVGNSLSIFVWKRLLTTRVRNTGELWRSKSIHTYLNNIEPNIWTKWYTVSWDIGVFKCESLWVSEWRCRARRAGCEPSSFSWLLACHRMCEWNVKWNIDKNDEEKTTATNNNVRLFIQLLTGCMSVISTKFIKIKKNNSNE